MPDIKPKIRINKLNSQNLEEFTQSADTHWNVNLIQMEAGSFEGNTTVIALEDIQIIHRTSKLAYCCLGGLNQDINLLLPLESSSFFAGKNQFRDFGQLAMTKTKRTCAFFPANFDYLFVTIKEKALEKYLDSEECEIFRRNVGTYSWLNIKSRKQKEITDFIYRIYREIQSIENTNKPEVRTSEDYTKLIILNLSQLLQNATTDYPPSESSYEKVFHRGLHYIRDNCDKKITLGKMASEIFASKRSIQYAFSKMSGMTPKQFIDAFRFNRIKSELAENDSSSAILNDILAEYPISNAPRFKQKLKRFFGEESINPLLTE